LLDRIRRSLLPSLVRMTVREPSTGAVVWVRVAEAADLAGPNGARVHTLLFVLEDLE